MAYSKKIRHFRNFVGQKISVREIIRAENFYMGKSPYQMYSGSLIEFVYVERTGGTHVLSTNTCFVRSVGFVTSCYEELSEVCQRIAFEYHTHESHFLWTLCEILTHNDSLCLINKL